MTKPSQSVVLAARHLDLTEGPLARPGHVLDSSDLSAIRTVVSYIAQAHREGQPDSGLSVGAQALVDAIQDARMSELQQAFRALGWGPIRFAIVPDGEAQS